MERRTFAISLAAVLVACGGASIGIGGTAGAEGPPPGGGPDVIEAKGDWTLEERQYWVKLQEELDGFAKGANDHCRTAHLTGAYVQDSFRGRLTAGGNYGLELPARSLCTGGLTAIRDVCTDGDLARKAMASSVKRMVCEYGKASSYSVRRGVFHVVINSASYDYATEFPKMVDVLRKSI